MNTCIIMERMIGYFGTDIRRINHALKVYSFSRVISRNLIIDEKQFLIIDATALLHDIGIREAEEKYHSSAGNYQEKEGPAIARRLLSDSNLETDVINRICHIIGNHHSYKKIDGVDFQILVEADLLVNMYEDSMSRESIRNLRQTIFKTRTGIRLLETMYPEGEKKEETVS